jgi:hypothetical protein
MARKNIGGWGHPNDEDISCAREISNYEPSKFGFDLGTISVLLSHLWKGEQQGLDLNTVSSYINNCGDYLLNGGDEKMVAELGILKPEVMVSDEFLNNEKEPVKLQPLDINFVGWIELALWIAGESRRREAKRKRWEAKREHK